jgi:nickel transport protein
MSNNRRIYFRAALLLPALLLSHGVEVSESENSVKIARFSYSDGKPMMYAKIKLYPPKTPTVETIKSLTDKNGFFAFVPDEEGEWRVEALDGMGHRSEIKLNVVKASLDTTDPEENLTQTSIIFRMILGLSLLLNIFAVYSFVLKRCKFTR